MIIDRSFSVFTILEENYTTLSAEGTHLQEIHSQTPLVMQRILFRLFLGVRNRFIHVQFQRPSHTTPTLQAMCFTSKQ